MKYFEIQCTQKNFDYTFTGTGITGYIKSLIASKPLPKYISALARLIRTVITRRNAAWLRKVDTRRCARDAWTKVREIIRGGRRRETHRVDGITAQVLNDHYEPSQPTTTIYRVTSRKLSAPTPVTEIQVFRILDRLQPTATGL